MENLKVSFGTFARIQRYGQLSIARKFSNVKEYNLFFYCCEDVHQIFEFCQTVFYTLT